MQAETGPVLLFDGVCNLCNRFILFVIRHDRKKQFKFASLQSEKGHELLAQGSIDAKKTDSVVLVMQGNYYVRSKAALKVLQTIGGAWSLLYGFIIIPRFIRDAVYDFIARNRYRIFGRKDECMVPTPELKERFLD